MYYVHEYTTHGTYYAIYELCTRTSYIQYNTNTQHNSNHHQFISETGHNSIRKHERFVTAVVDR